MFIDPSNFLGKRLPGLKPNVTYFRGWFYQAMSSAPVILNAAQRIAEPHNNDGSEVKGPDGASVLIADTSVLFGFCDNRF